MTDCKKHKMEYLIKGSFHQYCVFCGMYWDSTPITHNLDEYQHNQNYSNE